MARAGRSLCRDPGRPGPARDTARVKSSHRGRVGRCFFNYLEHGKILATVTLRMRTTLLALALLACGAVYGQVSIGIRIGPPPPPRVVSVLPPRPGPEFIWVE